MAPNEAAQARALRELPSLPDSTILVVEVGSGAHGTGLPGKEDHDETVIWVEPAADVFALKDHEPRAIQQRTAPEGKPSEPTDTDRNLYTLRRFLNLAVAGNPTIMLVLWAPVLQAHEHGRELRAMADAFVGRHLIPKYRGYMHAQTDRLLGLRGGRHGRMRETEAGFDTKYAMHAARLGFQAIELLRTGRLELPIADPAGQWLKDVRAGKVPMDEITTRIDELHRTLDELADDEAIPSGPDRARIIEWSIGVHRRWWDAATP
jgi:hypothetical protein